MFGLRKEDIEYIEMVLKLYPIIEYAGIFGQRSTGSHSIDSDIDIVLYGDDIDLCILYDIEYQLQNGAPYSNFINLKHYNIITDGILKNEIDEYVKIFYFKS